MTKAQIAQAVAGDDTARAALIAALTGADEDTTIHLVERLIAAARTDAADDIRVDLKTEGYRDAAELVESNYL